MKPRGPKKANIFWHKGGSNQLFLRHHYTTLMHVHTGRHVTKCAHLAGRVVDVAIKFSIYKEVPNLFGHGNLFLRSSKSQ